MIETKIERQNKRNFFPTKYMKKLSAIPRLSYGNKRLKDYVV
jgi:hypothetical protein